MVSNVGNILTPILGKQLIALRKTARTLDVTQLQLATGKNVNSAIDDPQNFFTSVALKNRANSLLRLLDGINQSIRIIQEASAGAEGAERLIQQAEAAAEERRSKFLQGLILDDAPVAYWQLNEKIGDTVAVNQGTGGTVLDGTYSGGVTLEQRSLYASGATAASFDGSAGQRVDIPTDVLLNSDFDGYPARSIEMVFKADDIISRQVLYEEGAALNNISIYIVDGSVYTTVRDNVFGYGPFTIGAPIKEGETYHVSLSFDSENRSFKGYLNGQVIGEGEVLAPFSRHTGAIAIGGMRNGGHFHDIGGVLVGISDYEFNGQISDVAVYNSVLSSADMAARYNAVASQESALIDPNVGIILEQLDLLVEDAEYRGIALLNKEDVVTIFNEDATSTLITEGTDLSSAGLGLRAEEGELRSSASIDAFIADAKDALNEVRRYGTTLANNLSIIETRQDFTRETINTLEAAGDDLVVADQNEVGANFLALQVRQEIQFSVLAFSSISSVEGLLSNA